MKKFLLALLLFPALLQAQFDTVFNYSSFTRSTAIYGSNNVAKSWKGDTVDLHGAFRQIQVKGETVYLQTPIGDTLIITKSSGDPIKDTIVSYSFKGGAVGFYYVGSVTPSGAIYDYLFISYPDTPIPDEKRLKKNWDFKSVNLSIVIVKKQATYSN